MQQASKRAGARCRAWQPRFKRNRRRIAPPEFARACPVLLAACWAAFTALELKARCARDVPFAFTVVFRVATIRSRPDAVGKGTLLF